MSPPKIEVYTKTHCPYCVQAKYYLKSHGINFVEHLLDDDVERRAFYDRIGDGVRTVPQIFVDGQRLGGYVELLNSDLAERYNVRFDEDF